MTLPQGGTPTINGKATVTDSGAATRVNGRKQLDLIATPNANFSVLGLGKATVKNNCHFPVYLYVCDGISQTCSDELTLAAHTGTYYERYPQLNDGRSIKIGKRPGETAK